MYIPCSDVSNKAVGQVITIPVRGWKVVWARQNLTQLGFPQQKSK